MFFFRTSEVVDIFRILVPGACGVAFGGPNRDILFVLTQAGIFNGVTNQFVREVIDGSSLYMITGLGVRDMPYSVRMNINKGHEANATVSTNQNIIEIN